jgi:hypothetical protein
MLPGGYAVLAIAADGTVTHARGYDGYRADFDMDTLAGTSIFPCVQNPNRLRRIIDHVLETGLAVTIRVALRGYEPDRIVRLEPYGRSHARVHGVHVTATVHKSNDCSSLSLSIKTKMIGGIMRAIEKHVVLAIVVVALMLTATSVFANPISVVPRAKAKNDLKQHLLQKYPGSYSTVEMLLNSGMSDYEMLCRIKSDPVNDEILNKLRGRYYPSFSTILMLYKANRKSYDNLNRP